MFRRASLPTCSGTRQSSGRLPNRNPGEFRYGVTKTALVALGVLGVLGAMVAGCSSRLGDMPLFNRFQRGTPILTEEIVSEEIVDSRPIISAPDGPVQPPDQLGPAPRVVPPQPMAKPLPYTPEDQEKDKKKPDANETKNEKKANP